MRLLALLVAVAAPAQDTVPITDADAERIIAESPVETLYLVASSHWDLGFAGPSDIMCDRVAAHIDELIDNCEREPDLRWTVESTWQVLEWLKRTPDRADQERFFDLVREGRIGIGATYGGMGTAWMGAEEICRLTYAAHRLRLKHDLPIDFAIMDDVPGYSAALPQVFAKSEVSSFLTGVNTTFGGRLSIPASDMPFWWEGPDGSRVLTWICHHYHESAMVYHMPPTAARFFADSFGRPFLKPIDDLERIQRLGIALGLQELAESGYDRDAALSMYSMDFISSDNGVTLAEWCRKWNESHDRPKLVQALPSEFFAHMREEYGDDFTALAGDWSGLWESGHAGAPVFAARTNSLRETLGPLETLATVAAVAHGKPYPHFRSDQLSESLLHVHEHGFEIGTGWPDLVNADDVRHNDLANSRLVEVAEDTARYILGDSARAITDAARTETQTITVVNPLSWPRTELVTAEMPRDLVPGEFRLLDDETGAEIAYQPSRGNEAAGPLHSSITFIASDVPSVGHRRYRIQPSESPTAATGPTCESGRLANEHLDIRVDEATGLIDSVTHVPSGRTIATDDFARLRTLRHRQDFFGIVPTDLADAAPATVEYHPGPATSTLEILRSEGALASMALTLASDRPELRVRLTLDYSRIPYAERDTHSNIYYATFGFDLPGNLSHRFDGPAGFLNPATDYLPTAFRGRFIATHVAQVSEADGLAVSMGCPQAGIVDLGGSGARDGSFAPESAVMRWKLLSRSDEGMAKDLGVTAYTIEPGAGDLRVFDFAFRVDASRPSAASTIHLGQGAALPMLARYSRPAVHRPFRPPPVPLDPSGSALSVAPESVVLLALKHATFGDRGDIIIRLMEIDGAPADVTLTTDLPLADIRRCNMLEEPDGDALPSTIPIGPREVLTLRARVER